MARLPRVGKDSGQWGDILNDFLSQAHAGDGSIKDGHVAKSKLSGAVQSSLDKADAAAAGALVDGSVSTSKLQNGAVTTDKLASNIQTSLTAADNAVPASQKGQANGVAVLDSTGKVPSSNLPSSVIAQSSLPLGVTLPNTWGEGRWRSTLADAKAGSKLAKVACIGASTSASWYTSDPDLGWFELVLADLKGGANGGSGWIGNYRSTTALTAKNVDSGLIAAWQASGHILATTGSWIDYGSNVVAGVPGLNAIASFVAGSTVSWQFNGKTLKAYMAEGGLVVADWQWRIDGGAWNNVTNSRGGTTVTVERTLATSLFAGTHTVELRQNYNGEAIGFIGFQASNDSGVVGNNFALPGETLTKYTTGTNLQWNAGRNLPADLVFVDLGTAGNQIANLSDGDVDTLSKRLDLVDTMETQLNMILDEVLDGGALAGQTDTIIMLPHAGTFVSGDKLKAWRMLINKVYPLAMSRSVGIVDVSAAYYASRDLAMAAGYFGHNGLPAGAPGSDSVHLSDDGAAKIASMVLAAIS